MLLAPPAASLLALHAAGNDAGTAVHAPLLAMSANAHMRHPALHNYTPQNTQQQARVMIQTHISTKAALMRTRRRQHRPRAQPSPRQARAAAQALRHVRVVGMHHREHGIRRDAAVVAIAGRAQHADVAARARSAQGVIECGCGRAAAAAAGREKGGQAAVL